MQVEDSSGVEPLAAQWRQIGRSFEGRAMLAATLGAGSKRLYLIGGVHGDELPGLEALPQLRDLLRQAGNRGDFTIRILQDSNPDGTHSRTRGNARGVDLNRNFPAKSFRATRAHGATAASEVETRFLLEDLRAFEPDVVVTFHAARQGPFVNYDGPGLELAERFVRGARSEDARWTVEAQIGYETPGSLGALLGDDEGLPVLTIEFPRAASASEVWPALSAGMLALLESEPSASTSLR